MAGQRKQTKRATTFVAEERLLRALAKRARREKTNRTALLTRLAEEYLEQHGEWP